jgi:alpha-L-fucosidase 2
MKRIIAVVAFLLISGSLFSQSKNHDLHFEKLANRWDEAIPLGNGMLGALVWQKSDHLRFSLDRADLWDMRPMKGLHRAEFSYQWVVDQVNTKIF